MIERNNSIGSRIEALRNEGKGKDGKKLTQQEVASGITTLKGENVSRETVKQWEGNERQLKSRDIIALADYYGVSCDYILRGIKADNLDIHKQTGLSDGAINNICSLTYPDSTDSVASRMGIPDVPRGITTRAEMLNGLLGDDVLFDLFTELLDAFIQNYELDAKYKTLGNNSDDSMESYVLALQDKDFLAFRAGKITGRICDTLQEHGKDNTALHDAYEVWLDEMREKNNAE